MLNIKPGANHRLKFKECVVCFYGIIWESVNELNAIFLNLIALFFGCAFKDFFVEIVGGYGNVKCVILEFLTRPAVISGEENDAERGVFACFFFDEVKGFICGFAVKDVMESCVVLILGFLNPFKEFVIINGLDELIQINEE